MRGGWEVDRDWKLELAMVTGGAGARALQTALGPAASA